MSDKVKINEIIDEFKFEIENDIDSYLHMTKESLIVFHLRNAWQELSTKGNISGYVQSRELALNNGWYLDLPEDYIRYVRISGVTDCGKLLPLFVDNKMSSASSYLKDNNDVLLLDDNDVPLLGTGTGIGNTTDSCSIPIIPTTQYNSYANTYGGCGSDYGRNYNLKSGVKSVHGQYKLDKENKIIQISDSPFENFVLEYVADITTYIPFKDIEVDRIYKEVLKNYVFWKITSRRRNVPMNEKISLEQEYRRSLKDAQLLTAPSLQEWKQIANKFGY